MAKIEVINADILKLPEIAEVEAVINSTNASKPGAAGLDYQIHKKAGKQLMVELKKMGIESKKPGDVFITSAPNLKYTYIIHTLVPEWTSEEESRLALKQCYISILDAAIKKNIKSIAFLALGVGHLGVPKVEGTEVAIEAVTEYLENHDSIETVWFVLSDNDVAKIYFKILKDKNIPYDTLQKELLKSLDESRDDLKSQGVSEDAIKAFEDALKNDDNIDLKNEKIYKLLENVKAFGAKGIKEIGAFLKDNPELIDLALSLILKKIKISEKDRKIIIEAILKRL
ncbi:macro domain-containing protein [Butyrivibrio sp. VCD2006]|uniref:macro domain-containing protein n=1 Tax=Butyrivibrio sp. VCD2006 TaxID=1280664 RepID=UPI00040DD470|nr:macro domain-containing protein [Butyrivibrio sp. VCD2006]